MSETLSSNAQAILMLTAPLIAGRGDRSTELLTPGEYKKLARRLLELEAQPADLLTRGASKLLGAFDDVIDKERMERLLARGFLLSQAVERWSTRAIWVVSRADPEYPQRLKTRLRENSPAVLYGCGERAILDSGGLAVVGSRKVDDALIQYTLDIGHLAASARQTLVSGGARGIDQASMRGALEEGGRATGVLADSLEAAAMNRENRGVLMEGQLVLISPYDPAARFNVGHAMQRNKLIYALADAALVVNTDLDKGGTWTGAREQLDKLRLVTVYVRSTGESSEGLDALRKKGALPWPNPQNTDGLDEALRVPVSHAAAVPSQSELSFTPQQANAMAKVDEDTAVPATKPMKRTAPATDDAALGPADELLRTVRALLVTCLVTPKQSQDVAPELGVRKRQAEVWLKQLVEEGFLRKRAKPVRYSVSRADLGGATPIEPAATKSKTKRRVKKGTSKGHQSGASTTDSAITPGRLAEELQQAVRASITRVLCEPRQTEDVAEELGVLKPQAEEWVKRLTEEGLLEKLGRPTRYVVCEADLFGVECATASHGITNAQGGK